MVRVNAKSIFMAVASALAFLLLFSYLFLHIESFPYHERLRSALKRGLTLTHELEPGPVPPPGAPKSIIYVMGGHQFNLRYRLGIAAGLYASGQAGSVITLRRPGITGYAHDIGRNLTNDEWAIRTLGVGGVKAQDIEMIGVDGGFFETLQETRKVAALARQRGYERLFVVSSLPHTRRVTLCFSNALQASGVEFYVYGSDDPVGLEPLLKEYLKLIIYRTFLLR